MKYFCFIALIFFIGIAKAQTPGNPTNIITTAMPFLTISPDARSGAMGDAGVALSADVNSIFWNPSKLVFLESATNVSLSYSPYMRNLATDMNLAYFSFAHKISDRNTFGASLHYFNLGNVDQYDENLNSIGLYSPNEFSFTGSFARKYGDNLSLGMSLRLVHSGLASGAEVEGQQARSINAISADVSLFHKKSVQQFGKDAVFAYGAMISNIGPKVNYANSGKKYFLPTNLKIGVANTLSLNDKNTLTLAFDVNKLLVPTPPSMSAEGRIIAGKSDDRSVVSGMFGSFGDAPGGFSEEIKEITYSPAVEYWYDKQFALRAGYFHESADKGNRKYTTVGAGFKYQAFNLDFSYLIANQARNQLANTLRFSLICNISK